MSGTLQSQVRFHRAMNAGLLGTVFRVLLLGFVVVRDTTKIVPPEVKRPYENGSNYANKDYLLDMAGYVLGTVLTVTPETVDYNNKVILKMADPDGYAGLKTALMRPQCGSNRSESPPFGFLAKRKSASRTSA
jgi:conjugal transfer pilus assembly protein TraE